MATEDPAPSLGTPAPPALPENFSQPTKCFQATPRKHFEPVKLHFAINHDDVEEAQKQIDRGLDLDFVVHGNTPLMLAMLRQQYDISRRLVCAGADVSIPEIYAWRRQPVHLAAKEGQAELVSLMLDRGASVHAADGMRMTPLHWACAHGSQSVVEVLLDRGAHVNARDDRGRTPLFRAVCGNHAGIVDLLNQDGDSVNTQDVYGWTPLHQAALCSLVIVPHLLELGAQVNVQNLLGDTALHMAVSRQSPHNLLTLSRTDLQFYTRDLKITSTCTEGLQSFISDRDLMATFLDHNCDLDVTNSEHQTALDLAVTYRNVMFIRWLAVAGARIRLPSTSQLPDTLQDLLRESGALASLEVRTLTDLAKTTIRKYTRPLVSSNIDLLPLPRPLKDILQISLV